MLLDTSGLLCLHYKTEPLHTQARSEYKKALFLLTHNYIIAEYVALANARRFPRSSVLAFVVDLLNNPAIETIWIDEPLHREAVELLTVRQDKTYSLCDSVSFVLMRQRGMTEALVVQKTFHSLKMRRGSHGRTQSGSGTPLAFSRKQKLEEDSVEAG